MPSSMNCLCLRLPPIFTPYQCRLFSSLRIIQSPALRPRSSSFHSTGDLHARKRSVRNDYFSSSAPRSQKQQDAKLEKPLTKIEESPQNNKRKTTRSQATKNSLQKVAVEAQRSKDGKGLKETPAVIQQETFKVGRSSGILDDWH